MLAAVFFSRVAALFLNPDRVDRRELPQAR